MRIDEALEFRNKNNPTLPKAGRKDLSPYVFPDYTENSANIAFSHWQNDDFRPKPEIKQIKTICVFCGVTSDFLLRITNKPN